MFVRNDKWVGHADMVKHLYFGRRISVLLFNLSQIYQYAHCVKDRLEAANMTNVAIYVDVWRSLNGRFQQRMVDPRVDLLEAEWSPFRSTSWLMPLLTELSPWRQKLNNLEQTVFNWSESARVAFVADFPGIKLETFVLQPINDGCVLLGLRMDNYVPEGVSNATLQVLEGQVELAIENGTRSILNVNETASLPSSIMHTITTTSAIPACYMYTFVGVATNSTTPPKDGKEAPSVSLMTPFAKSLALVGQSLLNLVFGIPLVTHK